MDLANKEKDFVHKNPALHECLDYYKTERLNILPLAYGDKKPVSEWKEYQTRRITKEEIDAFFLPDQKARNIGIVCGAISDNLFIIDFDESALFHRYFPEKDGLVYVKTGRGFHVYYKADKPVKTLKCFDTDGRELLTLKGEGSYVVAPPSLHPSGTPYEFVQRGEIPKLSGDVRQQVKEKAEAIGLTTPKEHVDIERILKGVPKGSRDTALTHFIHFLRRADVSKENVLRICEAWNERNRPPLGEVSYKVEYHYGLPEPYRYFYTLDPGLWTITNGLTLVKKSKKKSNTTEEKEKTATAIPLIYKDHDFGVLLLKKVKNGVLVTIKKEDAYLVFGSLQKFDFYLRDRSINTLFGFIKEKLKDDYANFLSVIKPQIEEVVYPKTDIRDETKTEEKAFDAETIAKAWELLHSPTLLFEIKQFLSKWGKYREEGVWKKKKPIVGEDGNKLHVTCSCLSALYSEKINDLVLGKSSVGKTRIVSIPSLLFGDRTEDLAGMTEAAPKNIEDNLDGKIFVLKEIEGSANAEYYLKILFDPESEDMKVRTSEKDPETNRYTSVVRQTRGKPVGITTTALPKYGIEFRNRFSLLQLDESKEQTRRIKDMEMTMKQEMPEDLTEEVDKFRCAFSLLQPMEVKIPFDVFYPSDEVEARRAFKRLLTLIEIVTLLHQYQREKIVGEDGITYLKATIADFYYAYVIAEASIGMDVQGLTENALKLYRALEKRYKEKKEEIWLVSEISAIIKADLNLSWTYTTLRGYLKELREEDYLTFYEDDSKRGKPYIYSLSSVDVKDVSFCCFFAQNQNQQKKVCVRAIEDGKEADGLFVFEKQKCMDDIYIRERERRLLVGKRINSYNGSFINNTEDEQGLYLYDPIDEKIICISSDDGDVRNYIHKHSYIFGFTNTNNKAEDGDGARDVKAASDLLNVKQHKKPQIKTQEGNVCDKCGGDGATELYQDCYFHPKCLEEVKHEEAKRKNKAPKVPEGISVGDGIEYEKMEARQ